MDIFKALSRSTKLHHNNRNVSTSHLQLPSSGKSTNPQLFQDIESKSHAKKRKREMENSAEDGTTLDDNNVVNYFAPTISVSKTCEKKSSNLISNRVDALDQSQCRKILRSHRIKIDVLKPRKVQDNKLRKQKKLKTIVKQEYKRIYPQPLMAFSDLREIYRISNRLATNLDQQGFKIPTEVQIASLPLQLQPEIAMKNCDDKLDSMAINLLTIAPTGSGKTLAFLIPIIDQILRRRKQRNDRKFHLLEALIIVPTKELADQILREAKILCKGTGVKVSGMRKTMRIVDDQLVQSTSGNDDEKQTNPESLTSKKPPQPITKADILVSTPGILLSSLKSKTSSKILCLPTIRTLVLDEADILLEPLFRDQTCSIWSALTSPHLCVTLWSATISSSVETLALSTIRKRYKEQPPLVRLVIGLKDSALPTISHTLTYCGNETGKLLALRNLIFTSPSSKNDLKALRPPIIIFTQTISRATALHAELLYDIPPHADGSSRIAVLHSFLSDTARSATLSRFRLGEVWILITTDILSRGVDIDGVNAVVNYDIPNDSASYVHRVGRTGRCGRKGGVAVTFYTREDVPYIRGVVNVIEASRKSGGKSNENEDQKSDAWLLEILPKLAKVERKKLKLRGVEVRREDWSSKKSDKGEISRSTRKIRPSTTRISTKSGYERRQKNRRQNAIEASNRKKILENHMSVV